MDVGYSDHVGRPLKYDAETIERALFETAAQGGSSKRAHESLLAQGVEAPPERTIRSWVTGRFRNRYQQISSEGARRLEEQVAIVATENAIRLGDAEARALAQTLAGLGYANGVEASVILRNISQSKAVQVDKAALLRGRPTVIAEDRSLSDIARALNRMGLIDDGPTPVANLGEPMIEAVVADD